MRQALRWTGTSQRGYTDNEVVEGLQSRNRTVEEWFYKTAKRYFDEHFNEVFFDKDRKQEIFQAAFLKLWMEIDNHRIQLADKTVSRQQANGEYKPLTCTLTTFLMAFAKTEHRELVRSSHEEFLPEVGDTTVFATAPVTVFDHEEDVELLKNRIVDECISQMPPRCLEILTLFYYEGKSLNEIMNIRQEKNSSKNGLKTAKNKCMNTLRERITAEFEKFHFKA